ncbi:hypothetical protein CDCA_CDCA10G3070 [Cyanidium caldarium]|uniref:Carbonyl reductase n=1 Tax=Cyanidium caldarium TaxID=2771 RepID=A0AAV9IY81_CYACA|nr:hypothetical protein CDCA_CDCA10G3070 [Cyanidium caldarium]
MSSPLLAIVTGSNKGIGRAIALRMARETPMQVVVTARDAARAKQAAEEMTRQLQQDGEAATAPPTSEFWPHQLNLLDGQSIERFARYVQSLNRRVDVLVNNAGMAYKGDAFNRQVAEETLQCNYFGTKHLTELLLPHVQPDGGRVVMVSSRAGAFEKLTQPALRSRMLEATTVEQLDGLAHEFIESAGDGTYAEKGWPRQTYAVSKMLLTAYTVLLAKRMAPTHPHLLINAMCPGYVDTDMTSHRGVKTTEQGADTAVFLARLPREVEQQREMYSGHFWAERQRMALPNIRL